MIRIPPKSPRISRSPCSWLLIFFLAAPCLVSAQDTFADVYLEEVPDYHWYAGCFGTANGNLFGYWDRSGLPDFYTGPTAGGVAPLDDCAQNVGIRSMWASAAGLDGRPMDQPGHIDDYWDRYTINMTLDCRSLDSYSYESTLPDPYETLGREEHAWDCIGDFIGLSQNKWTDMNGECDGNIDAYSFVYWDKSGQRRWNYTPPAQNGDPVHDIQSGLKAWTEHRGYAADVFTQLTDFNPATPEGTGFTFEDLKHEIDRGYPVMVFLQPFTQMSRSLNKPDPMPLANPDIHGVLIYGYAIDEFGPLVRIRTSWSSGDNRWEEWTAGRWVGLPMQARGVIGYHPKPMIKEIRVENGQIHLAWDGPSARLRDEIAGTSKVVHRYVVEYSETLDPENFEAVTTSSAERAATVPASCCGPSGFFRVTLLEQ